MSLEQFIGLLAGILVLLVGAALWIARSAANDCRRGMGDE